MDNKDGLLEHLRHNLWSFCWLSFASVISVDTIPSAEKVKVNQIKKRRAIACSPVYGFYEISLTHVSFVPGQLGS